MIAQSNGYISDVLAYQRHQLENGFATSVIQTARGTRRGTLQLSGKRPGEEDAVREVKLEEGRPGEPVERVTRTTQDCISANDCNVHRSCCIDKHVYIAT